MTSSIAAILCVGAAGKFAGLVVPELAKRAVKVRGLIRHADDAEKGRKHGAAEIAIGDLRGRASVDAALNGVDSVFYIAPAFQPDEAELGARRVDAAKRAGVRRFVFSSVIDPILSALVNHSAKAPVEEAILDSNMEYSLVAPNDVLPELLAELAGGSEDGSLFRTLVDRDSLYQGRLSRRGGGRGDRADRAHALLGNALILRAILSAASPGRFEPTSSNSLQGQWRFSSRDHRRRNAGQNNPQ